MAQTFSLEALIFVVILLAYIFISHALELHKTPYLHQSTAAILMGVFTAFLAKYGLQKQIQFSNQLFFAIILPPIIFSAGYSLRKSEFVDNFGVIALYGIVGTLIGFLCMTGFIFALNKYIFNALTLLEVLMLSSILCASDTVTSLSLIKPKRFPVLHALLFGQSILNNAVAIILFHTTSQLKLDLEQGFTFINGLELTFHFSYLFVFSMAFGMGFGFALSYLFKRYELFLKHPIKETSLILLNGYFTYLMGELMGLSGIISLFTCAIIMGHYCFMNISEESQKGTGLAFETVGYIAEAFILAYLGASVLAIEGKLAAVMMAFLILAALPVMRALMVYFLPTIYRLLSRNFPVQPQQLKIYWFNGMIRGAVAFALCLQIDSKDRKYITTVCMVIVMVTTLLGSTLLRGFKKYIGVQEQRPIDQKEQELLDILNDLDVRNRNKIRDNSESHTMSSRRVQKQKTERKQPQAEDDNIPSSTPLGKLEQFESKFIKPLFVKAASTKRITYDLEEDQKKQQI